MLLFCGFRSLESAKVGIMKSVTPHDMLGRVQRGPGAVATTPQTTAMQRSRLNKGASRIFAPDVDHRVQAA